MHCPTCGTIMKIHDKNLVVCPSCDHHEYNNPRPTNGVIFENEKGEILLVGRKYDPKKGYWDIPGGFVNIEETMEESVKREVKEELNISLKKFTYLCSKRDRYQYKGQNYHVLMFVFVSKDSLQDVSIGDDVSDVKFFPKDKIPFEKLAFDGVKEAIKDYIS